MNATSTLFWLIRSRRAAWEYAAARAGGAAALCYSAGTVLASTARESAFRPGEKRKTSKRMAT